MGSILEAERDAALETGPLGRPRVLRWRRRTYLVSDAPTPLEDALAALTTHPLPVHGWRFQGTDELDGETLVFDVVAFGDGWRVVKTYA